MIFGKTKLEMKVGVFVFIGLLILTIFILRISEFKFVTGGYPIKIMFNFANGVKIGAPVRFAGVDIGEVKRLSFVFVPEEQKTKIQILSWVTRQVDIPRDSTVWVNTLGLLGEKYIEIIPGKDYADVMTKGDTIVGVDPIPMHEVTNMAMTIAQDIDESIVKIKNGEGTVGKLLYDDTIYKELEALVIDLRKHPWKLFWKGKEKK